MAEILLADDERAVREGLKALLVGEGFSVRTARDGADAVAKFSEKRPDAVLLDVMMPKSNGFKACEEMRALDPLVPVVFLTAKDSEADQIRGMGLGADDFISKSAGEEVLLARLRRALARAEAFTAAGREARVIRLGRVSVAARWTAPGNPRRSPRARPICSGVSLRLRANRFRPTGYFPFCAAKDTSAIPRPCGCMS